MQTVPNCSYRQTISANRRNSRRLLLPLTLSLMVSGLFLQPRYAHADDYIPGTTIYLVTESGLTDVTYTYSDTDNTVLDEDGMPIQVTLDYLDKHVVDLNGDVIGILE